VNRTGLLSKVGLVLGACAAVAALSQCRLVDDSITGVDLKNNVALNARGECVRSCNDAFKMAMQDEAQRYKDAVRECGNDRECRDAERARHDEITDGIQAAKKSCKDGCYNEGGGSGGR